MSNREVFVEEYFLELGNFQGNHWGIGGINWLSEIDVFLMDFNENLERGRLKSYSS